MTTIPAPPEIVPARKRAWLLLHTHPFEVALSAILVVNGVRGLWGALSPSLYTLPKGPLVAYLVVSIVGGLATLVGMWRAQRTGGKAWEAAGLWLVAASYAGFAVLILQSVGTPGITTAATCIVIALACVFRVRAIRRTQTVILETLRNATREDPASE